MQKIIATIIILSFANLLIAQVDADVVRGCVPLEVNFNYTGSGTVSNYFWDFGDGGGNSDQTSPSRIFTNPGVYNVQLSDGEGGPSQGTVEVTVYAVPQIQISASEQLGCAPFFVEFTNETVLDPDIIITGYQWDFGDGVGMTEENPTHTYDGEGTFDVALQIFSSLPECGTVVSFEDFITVSGSVAAGFLVDKLEDCDAPATFTITNNTPDDPAYSYEWTFGDGSATVTVRNPGTHTYDQPGNYTITLKVNNGDGCIVTRQRDVRVGGPDFQLNIPDTLCIDLVYPFINTTDAATFQWSIGGGGFPATSFAREPRVQFFTEGNKLISLTATSPTGCVSDTTFAVYVQDLMLEVTVDPEATCSDPVLFTASANMDNLASYTWNGIPGISTYQIEYRDFQGWDSFHINRPDTTFFILNGISTAGCQAAAIGFGVFQDIEAHIVPDVSRGCAPLTVEFEQKSISIEPFIRYDYDFGDGSTLDDVTGNDITHTFENPGEYYVKMIVENDNGCIDTSTGIWIYVGETLGSEVTIDQTEICLFDSITLSALNLDDRIDAWHFETDEGRNGHCYIDPNTSHTFVTKPGSYPITLDVEYNGCFNKVEVGSMQVNGAKALIQYMTNCDDPYTVMLQDSSFGASSTAWTIEGNTFDTGDLLDSILNYTFADTGIYKIYLEAFDNTSTCPSNIDSVEVHIVDIFASFTVDSINCEGPILFDATSSVGVDDRCSKGYTWFFPTNRPRRISEPTIVQGLFQGPDPDRAWQVRLEVEDINGCTDDTMVMLKVYDIDAEFAFDSEGVCFPSEVVLTDQSISDTTIVSWQWSTTSTNDSIVTYTAMGDAEVDSLETVQLIVVDALGCTDTLQREVETYEIFSIPTVSPIPLCVGDSLFFSATDYTEDGSFLNFEWTVPNLINSTEQSFATVVNARGVYNANLKIEEDASGCTNEYDVIITVVDIPIAGFSSDIGPEGTICIGDQVNFTNGSNIDGSGGYIWSFGNGATSTEENPIATFNDRGTFDIELIALSSAGCSDTSSTQVTTTGPIGDIMVDNDIICQSGEVTFSLVNPEGVGGIRWDFGDGEGAEDVMTVSHTYDQVAAGTNSFTVVLTLQGEDELCEVVIEREINLFDIRGGFTIEPDSLGCPGNFIVTSQASGFDAISYTVDGIEISTSSEPVQNVIINSLGEHVVTQVVSSLESGCVVETTKEIEVLGSSGALIPNLFTPNGDSNNDFFNIVLKDAENNPIEGECVEVVTMQVYDRWGKLLYDNDTTAQGWNGTIGGSPAPADTYLYVITVQYEDGMLESFRGNVMLMY